MSRKEIEQLTQALADALFKEHKAKKAVESAMVCAELVKARVLDTARADGLIDGKNADTRKRQVAAALAASEAYPTELCKIIKAQSGAITREIERKRQEAVVGLTKAWLYSQSGRISIGLGT